MVSNNDSRVVKVMADYGCFPTWSIDEKGLNNINPYDLGLDRELCEQLNAWAARFDSILDLDDPPSSQFASRSDEIEFLHEGR
jgi:hypothetical protein